MQKKMILALIALFMTPYAFAGGDDNKKQNEASVDYSIYRANGNWPGWDWQDEVHMRESQSKIQHPQPTQQPQNIVTSLSKLFSLLTWNCLQKAE